jgi:ParB family transcriptional regulator, chromosome partitioning protein
MGDESRSRGLGRGLSALLGDDVAPAAAPQDTAKPRTLPVAFLKPNRFQPRRTFREEDLRDLANSIREKGVLQAIVVRPGSGPEDYEIVAGERRWRAAQLAKLHEVPVSVREFTDSEALEVAIVENVQRADLNAIEEGAAYQELMQRFQYTQEQLSDVVGKSRSHIANTLRLLKLPDPVKLLVVDGKLTAGHARTLIGVPDAEKRAKEIVAGALNVRQAEQKAKAPARVNKPKSSKDADTKSLEQSVTNALGMKVEIQHQGDKGGEVRIRYRTLEQLDEIMHRLSTFVEVD